MNKILPIILVVVLFFFPELLLSYERDAWEGGSSRLGGGSGIGGFLIVPIMAFVIFLAVFFLQQIRNEDILPIIIIIFIFYLCLSYLANNPVS